MLQDLRGVAKSNRDTSIPPTTYSEEHKQANQTAGDIGAEKCRGGSAISVLSGTNAASAVSRVNIIAAMMLSTAKARVLMRPDRGETA